MRRYEERAYTHLSKQALEATSPISAIAEGLSLHIVLGWPTADPGVLSPNVGVGGGLYLELKSGSVRHAG